MKSKAWIFAMIAAAVSIAASVGFNFPGTRLGHTEQEIVDIKKHVNEHDVALGVVNTKLDYLADGIDEILERPKRRARAK